MGFLAVGVTSAAAVTPAAGRSAGLMAEAVVVGTSVAAVEEEKEAGEDNQPERHGTCGA